MAFAQFERYRVFCLVHPYVGNSSVQVVFLIHITKSKYWDCNSTPICSTSKDMKWYELG